MKSRRRNQRGSTLTETVTAVMVISAMSGGLFTMMSSSSGMYKTSLRSSLIRNKTIKTWSVLRDELEQVNTDTFVIDTKDYRADTMDYQLPLTMKGSDVVWGATVFEKQTWVDYPNAFVHIGPVTRRDGDIDLVRQVLSDVGGNPIGPEEVLARDLQVGSADGKGLELWLDGSFLTVSMRLDNGYTTKRGESTRASEMKSSFRVGAYGNAGTGAPTGGGDPDGGINGGGPGR